LPATGIKVRYSPRIARWIAEREGVAPSEDGSLTLEHPLADTAWGVRHVLQYGPDAEVLEPVSLRDEIARRLSAMNAR
jgi:predicted DNA-binding transcriptional regulator YafY